MHWKGQVTNPLQMMRAQHLCNPVGNHHWVTTGHIMWASSGVCCQKEVDQLVMATTGVGHEEKANASVCCKWQHSWVNAGKDTIGGQAGLSVEEETTKRPGTPRMAMQESPSHQPGERPGQTERVGN